MAEALDKAGSDFSPFDTLDCAFRGKLCNNLNINLDCVTVFYYS